MFLKLLIFTSIILIITICSYSISYSKEKSNPFPTLIQYLNQNISSCEDLKKIEKDLSANYSLKNDLNCNLTINGKFNGIFEGNKKNIFSKQKTFLFYF
jgi:hypothetical protein